MTVIKEHVDAMIEARKVANKIESEREKAIAYHDNIVPMMEEIRYHIDKLELIVDNQMWTLPKYRELLFIRWKMKDEGWILNPYLILLLVVLSLQGGEVPRGSSLSFFRPCQLLAVSGK